MKVYFCAEIMPPEWTKLAEIGYFSDGMLHFLHSELWCKIFVMKLRFICIGTKINLHKNCMQNDQNNNSFIIYIYSFIIAN